MTERDSDEMRDKMKGLIRREKSSINLNAHLHFELSELNVNHIGK